jgi:hypothetical protein
MAYRIFDASSDFFREFTRVNDFAQVCAASVWTMRWQVKGFFAEVGFYSAAETKPKQNDLKSRFLAGSGLRRANFRSLVDGQTWYDQLSILAEMTLLTIMSLFEGWTDAIGEEAVLSKSNREALQWPSQSRYPRYNNAGTAMRGIREALQAGRSRTSAVMEDCFYPAYSSDRQYSLTHIDELMICYRYWKEVRNALAHAGGRATSRVLVEQGRLFSLTAVALGMSRVPGLPLMALNDPIPIELESILGFGEVLQRIVVTTDAELSVNQEAEGIMIGRWEAMRRVYYQDPPLSLNRSRVLRTGY